MIESPRTKFAHKQLLLKTLSRIQNFLLPSYQALLNKFKSFFSMFLFPPILIGVQAGLIYALVDVGYGRIPGEIFDRLFWSLLFFPLVTIAVVLILRVVIGMYNRRMNYIAVSAMVAAALLLLFIGYIFHPVVSVILMGVMILLYYGDTHYSVFRAIDRNDREKVLEIARKYPENLKNKDNRGLDPINYAWWKGRRLSIICLLMELEAEIDPDAAGQSPLTAAYNSGHRKIREFLAEWYRSLLEELVENRSEILRVAATGNPAEVKKALENELTRANINEADTNGCTALHLAAKWLYGPVVEAIVSGGGDMNSRDPRGNTPLHLALEHNNIEAARVLIKRSENLEVFNRRGITPLLSAINNSDREVVELLLERGARVDVGGADGKKASHFAANRADRGIIEKLADRGCDFNTRDKAGFTPLHYAARNGSVDGACALLQNGAEFDPDDRFLRTLINKAIKHKRRDFIELLENSGVKAEPVDFEILPSLHKYALLTRKWSIKDFIHDCRDRNELNEKGPDGNTLLHCLVEADRSNFARVYLDNGGDPHIKNNRGETPLDLARKLGRNRMVRLLSGV